MKQNRGVIVCLVAGMLAAVASGGCHDEPATGPQVTGVQLAKSGSQDPDVTGTDPASAPQDTTLDVEVSGSGFENGSAVVLTLSGVPTEKVRTNSTRYRNSRTLIANITIAADAEVDFYDVEVTTLGGKKGIGTEMFEVFEKSRGNATTATLDFWEPLPGDPDDPYNLRSEPQLVSRWEEGSWVKYETYNFPLTLAFSQTDGDAMNDEAAPVPGECPIVREWLFGNGEITGLQERAQPLEGRLRFAWDRDADVAILSFYMADPFGEDGKYTYILRLSASPGPAHIGYLTVSAGTTGMTFITEGSSVSINKWRHAKNDPYKNTQAVETPSCKLRLGDFTLTVIE